MERLARHDLQHDDGRRLFAYGAYQGQQPLPAPGEDGLPELHLRHDALTDRWVAISPARTLADNDSFTVSVPFAANWPYEAHVRAKRHGTYRLTDLSVAERRDLAQALRAVVHTSDRLYPGRPLAYMMVCQQAPSSSSGAPAVDWHLSFEFLPRTPMWRSFPLPVRRVHPLTDQPRRVTWHRGRDTDADGPDPQAGSSSSSILRNSGLGWPSSVPAGTSSRCQPRPLSSPSPPTQVSSVADALGTKGANASLSPLIACRAVHNVVAVRSRSVLAVFHGSSALR